MKRDQEMPQTREDWESFSQTIAIPSNAFINGKGTSALSERYFTKTSPIDNRHLADIARCDAPDVSRAVRAARAAFEDRRWRRQTPKERKKTLLRLAELMMRDLRELALLETLDVGKVISNSIAVDVPFAADCIAYYAEYADKLFDEIAPVGDSNLALIRKEPLGVVGAIVPWNYPLIITAWKIAPALLAGNSVVLKPAEQSTLSALKLAALAQEAGLPDGVLNVVPGFGEEAGAALALHPDVDMITFTGSTEIGKTILRHAANSNMKRVSLECGGKSPQIVCADCEDLNLAAEAIAWGIYYNQGETCHAGSRLLVQESIHEELIERIKTISRDIPLGHPLDPKAAMGALVEKRHMERVLSYIALGQEEGAQLALGGRQCREESGGYYIEATILDQARNDMRISQEEIFGPVLVAIPFREEAEALSMANDSSYGLAAAIWTKDVAKAHRMADHVRAGTVWINSFDRSSITTPFGGFKQSGFGRDRSPHAIDKYTDYKTIWTAWP